MATTIQTRRRMGVVRDFKPDAGYGFLTDDFSERIFFHGSKIINCDPSQVVAGMTATFEVMPTSKGPAATAVIILGI